MCVAGYLGPDRPDLLRATEVLTQGVAELQPGLSIPKALPETVARSSKRYGSVGDYDPVLRAHCRLDKEG
jgi:hypothetical protein